MKTFRIVYTHRIEVETEAPDLNAAAQAAHKEAATYPEGVLRVVGVYDDELIAAQMAARSE